MRGEKLLPNLKRLELCSPDLLAVLRLARLPALEILQIHFCDGCYWLYRLSEAIRDVWHTRSPSTAPLNISFDISLDRSPVRAGPADPAQSSV